MPPAEVFWENRWLLDCQGAFDTNLIYLEHPPDQGGIHFWSGRSWRWSTKAKNLTRLTLIVRLAVGLREADGETRADLGIQF